MKKEKIAKLIEHGLQTVNQSLEKSCKKFEQNTKKDNSDMLCFTTAAMPKQITTELDKISSKATKPDTKAASDASYTVSVWF